MIQMHIPTVNDWGGAPAAEHDMPCAVCSKQKAVYDLAPGRFLPCWGCQRKGWQLVNVSRIPRPLLRLLMFWTVQV